MKKILLLLAYLPISSLACIIPPTQLQASGVHGFRFIEKSTDFYESITEIKIVAPLKYKGHEFDLSVYSIYLNDTLIAKSIHSSFNENGEPEFVGYVSNKVGFSYRVSFLYGEGAVQVI